MFLIKKTLKNTYPNYQPMAEGKWHAVYTRPGREKQLVKLLAKKKIGSYLPVNKSAIEATGGKKLRMELLLPRMVFVYIQNDSQQQLVAKNSDVINFVYWLNSPAIINQEEIEAIRYFLNEYSCTSLEKAPVQPGAHLKNDKELQLVKTGNVVAANIVSVKLTLPSLGKVLVAQVRKDTAGEFIYKNEKMAGSISGS